jgi:hypothetical protein
MVSRHLGETLDHLLVHRGLGTARLPSSGGIAPNATAALPPIEVYFSAKGGCTEAVVRELNTARSTVLVQAYSFTSAPIAKVLVDAYKRGVNVQVILLLWTAIVATMVEFWSWSALAGILFAPYLAWVSFAAVPNCVV